MSSAFAVLIIRPLAFGVGFAIGLSPTYEDLGLSVSGGALYGLGTFINGACGFGTAARVFSGTMLGVQITLAVSVKRWKDRKVQWGEVTVRRIAALTRIDTALDWLGMRI